MSCRREQYLELQLHLQMETGIRNTTAGKTPRQLKSLHSKCTELDIFAGNSPDSETQLGCMLLDSP